MKIETSSDTHSIIYLEVPIFPILQIYIYIYIRALMYRSSSNSKVSMSQICFPILPHFHKKTTHTHTHNYLCFCSHLHIYLNFSTILQKDGGQEFKGRKYGPWGNSNFGRMKWVWLKNVAPNSSFYPTDEKMGNEMQITSIPIQFEDTVTFLKWHLMSKPITTIAKEG